MSGYVSMAQKCSPKMRCNYVAMYNDQIPLTSDFFPFGVSNGDMELTMAIDGNSGPISLETPIVFFQEKYITSFVSFNIESVRTGIIICLNLGQQWGCTNSRDNA